MWPLQVAFHLFLDHLMASIRFLVVIIWLGHLVSQLRPMALWQLSQIAWANIQQPLGLCLFWPSLCLFVSRDSFVQKCHKSTIWCRSLWLWELPFLYNPLRQLFVYAAVWCTMHWQFQKPSLCFWCIHTCMQCHAFIECLLVLWQTFQCLFFIIKCWLSFHSGYSFRKLTP